MPWCCPACSSRPAFHLDFHDFRRDVIAIVALAVPGVVAAIGLTALILSLVAGTLQLEAGFGWQHALVFGAARGGHRPDRGGRPLPQPRRAAGACRSCSRARACSTTARPSCSSRWSWRWWPGSRRRRPAAWCCSFLEIVGGGRAHGTTRRPGRLGKSIQRVDDPMIEITLTTIAAYGVVRGGREPALLGRDRHGGRGHALRQLRRADGHVALHACRGRDVLGVHRVRAELDRLPADRLRGAVASLLALAGCRSSRRTAR